MSALARFEQAFHDHFSRNPNQRVFLGIDRDLGELPDPSRREEAERLHEARKLLEVANDMAREQLSTGQLLDLDLARLKLEAEIHDGTFEFAGSTTSPQMPRAGDEIGDGIFMIFINDPRPAEVRLSDISSRIEQIPDYLESMLSRLENPVARWVDIEREKIDGLPQLFDTIASWATDVAWADRGKLERSIDEANRALANYTSLLSDLPSHDDFHIGLEETKRLIELRGIDASPDELRELAREFLFDISATLENLRGELAEKYGLAAGTNVADVHAMLNQRFAVEAEQLDDILVHYQTERKRVVDFCRSRNLFDIPEDQDLKIMRTPGFMAPSIPAGAMMPPAPFRQGTKTSMVYLTLSEELRDEHTALGIPSMIIHEGIPGHHLQLASAAGHGSLIRRHVNANDQAEGWTTMLEDYMLEIGVMGELEAEARFIGKRDIARLGARVAIDLFFMSGDKSFLDIGVECDLSSDDPFTCAGSLLAEVTGFTDGRVQAELNWYSQERGYPLSYLAGNRAVWNIRNQAKEHNRGRLEGDDFAREFHRVYLEAGNMPVSFLSREYISAGLLPPNP